MRLTIVTPSLNQLGFLRECVASVRRQGGDVEHIVSDGGSIDGTVAWLAGLGLRFRSAPDGGMYEALNAGIEMSTGDVVGYLNCDDLLLPWCARVVLEVFEAHPGVEWIVADSLEQRGERWALTVHPPARLLRRFVEAGGHFAQPSVFFRRRLYDRLGGFDPRFRLLGDHDFWCRALSTGAPVRRVWEFLSVQRMVEGQLMERCADDARIELAQLRARHRLYAGRRERMVFSRLVSGGLHRAGIAAVGLGGGVARGPWKLLRSSGMLERGPVPEVVMAMFGPSARRTYLRAKDVA